MIEMDNLEQATQRAIEESTKFREEGAQQQTELLTAHERESDNQPPIEHIEDHALGRPEPVTTVVVKIAPGQDGAVPNLLNEVIKAKKYADTRTIVTADDAKDATNDLTLMSGLRKSIEEKRQQYVGPLNEHIKAVNDSFKFLTEPLAIADKTTRQKVTAYRLEQERIQRVQEEINRKRREAAEAEMALKGELTESVNEVAVTEAPKLTRAALGTTGMAANWKFEVTDPEAIPRQYLVPDAVVLNAIAKKDHDKRSVPGIRFYNDPGIRVYNKS